MNVSLTKDELMQAVIVAAQRNVDNLFNNRKDAHGASRDNGWNLHIEGAAGEMAVAKYLNRYWYGNIGNLKANDVGSHEVRTTPKHENRLIVHKSDPDDRYFILVTGLSPEFKIRGFMLGSDAKQEKYWSDPAGGRPAYFVPAGDLTQF